MESYITCHNIFEDKRKFFMGIVIYTVIVNRFFTSNFCRKKFLHSFCQIQLDRRSFLYFFMFPPESYFMYKKSYINIFTYKFDFCFQNALHWNHLINK